MGDSLRIWQAGKKREALHIFDPIVNGIGNALMIGTEVHMCFEAKQTGIYTGEAKLADGSIVEYEFTGVRY